MTPDTDGLTRNLNGRRALRSPPSSFSVKIGPCGRRDPSAVVIVHTLACMTARRIVAVLAAITLVGCSGSDDDPALVPDSTPATAVSDDELRDGAFEENEGEREPGDAPTSTTAVDDREPTESETDTTTTQAQTGDDAGDDADDDTGTDTGDGATDGPSSATGGGSSATSTTGAATTAGTATGGTGSTATATGGTGTDGTDGSSGSVGSTGEVEGLRGVVTIGDDTYEFDIDECAVRDDVTSARGDTALDGSPFIVRVSSSVIDLNNDGAPDTTIDINIDPDGDGEVPAFSVAGVKSTTAAVDRSLAASMVTTAFDIDFTVTTDRIVASGPILDTSVGETVPMRLDIRCA